MREPVVTAPAGRFGSGGSYLRFVLSEQRSRALSILVLLLAGAALNAFSIALVAPLLHLIGLSSGVSGQMPGMRWIGALFAAIGLPVTLTSVLVLYLLTHAATAWVNRGQAILNTDLQSHVTESLRNRLHSAITHAGWLFLVRIRKSDLVHAMCDELNRVTAGTTVLPRWLGAVVLLLVYVGASLWVSPVLSSIVLAAALLFMPLWVKQGRRARSSGREVGEISKDFYGRLTDHLAGLKEVKILGAEEPSVDAFRTLTHRMKTALLAFTRRQADAAFIHMVGTSALMCGLVWLAVGVLRMPPAQWLLLVYLFTRITPRIQEIQTCREQVLHMLPAYEALMRLIERCEAARDQETVASLPPHRLEHGIELRHVSFSYDSEVRGEGSAPDCWALRDAHFTIPARTTTAIVGPSGAGKSTLADLLMGLLVPTEGVVVVDGHVLEGEARSAWRRSIGYVPQDTFLLHATVRENLMWAAPSAEEADLWKALELAAADTVVRELPQGLETVLGDRGVRLSGGERQRLALARALLRRPSVLILDEATSALDSENQLRIQQTIDRLRGDLTLILIAHRFSTLRGADQIVVLDGGRVVEIGGHDSLLQREEGRFRALFEADWLSRA